MKVGIVGCGINGAYLAWKLSKEHDVTVFEKNNSIGEKPCSGLISERIWDFIPKHKDIVLNTIETLIIHFPNKDLELTFYPKMLVLDRKKLTDHVVQLAEKEGAKINLNSDVESVFFVRGKRPQISVSGKIYEFDYLIGCDGYKSLVRKSLKIPDPISVLGMYTRIKKKKHENNIDVYPLKKGITWLIPRKNEIEYGIFERPEFAKNDFSSFCRRMRIKPKKVYSSLIPGRLVTMHKGRIALCGDAIGLTKPWSYGGIIWGLIGDDILIKTFPNFRKYEEHLRDFFEPKIFFAKILVYGARFIGDRFSWITPKELYFDPDWIF